MRRAAFRGAVTPPSVFGLRHNVGLFFAYFEHRRRASTRDRRGPSQAIAAVADRIFVFVQYLLIASVAVIFPDHFIYSESRGRHRHFLPHAD